MDGNFSFLQVSGMLLLAFVLGWFCAMSSGALFAYITFRTKRESSEPLFQIKQPKGSVSYHDPFDEPDPERKDRSPVEPQFYPGPEVIFKENERFLGQLMARKTSNEEGAQY